MKNMTSRKHQILAIEADAAMCNYLVKIGVIQGRTAVHLAYAMYEKASALRLPGEGFDNAEALAYLKEKYLNDQP